MEELYFKYPIFSLFLPYMCIHTWYRDIFGLLSAWSHFIGILIWTLALWLWNMPSLFSDKKNEIIELKTMSLKLWFFPKPTSFWLLYLYFPGRIVSLLYKIMLPMCFCPALVCSKICFKFFVHKWSVPFQITTPSDHEFLEKVPFQWQLRLVQFCRAESS